MTSDRDGGRPSAPADSKRPKLTVAGPGTDGTLKSRDKVPGPLRAFTLPRGADERPLQFEGEVIAETEATTSSASVLRAAIYRTKGGQHVSEFSRRDERSNITGKSMVFESLDDAIKWFRPGKLTTSLLKQLGRWDAEVLDDVAVIGDDDMNLDLMSLLESPVESPAVEYKSWIDIGEGPGRATLAKAAIALANHGGGVIVFGMRHEDSKGELQSQPRPEEIDEYTQDAVNAAINRFAEPEMHCELSFEVHPETRVKHAFVTVPGGKVPVMSRREFEGVIGARKYYIRKPGPRSEEPLTGQDWTNLMNRCVIASRENMLESLRAIVRGRATVVHNPGRGEALTAVAKVARERWIRLTNDLPADDPARFSHGHYETGFEIDAMKPAPSLTQLRDAMRQASTIKHTGWGPFVQLSRDELKPSIVGGAIEAWLGPNTERALGREPSHCDYWRADPAGTLILMRGYDEDGPRSGREPGTAFDITLPVWRVGEAILYIGRLTEQFAENLPFLVRCEFRGLSGRRLVHIEGRRLIFDDWRCIDNEVTLEREVTSSQVRDNLVEVVHGLLKPLYERFSFFQLPERLVAEELKRLMQNRF